MKTYIVTRTFLTGILAGMEHTGRTAVKFELGKIYTEAITGTRYRITKIVEA